MRHVCLLGRTCAYASSFYSVGHLIYFISISLTNSLWHGALGGISILPDWFSPLSFPLCAASSSRVDDISQSSRIRIHIVWRVINRNRHPHFLYRPCIHTLTSITISLSLKSNGAQSLPLSRGKRRGIVFGLSQSSINFCFLFLILFPLSLISPSGYQPSSRSLKAQISPLSHHPSSLLFFPSALW